MPEKSLKEEVEVGREARRGGGGCGGEGGSNLLLTVMFFLLPLSLSLPPSPLYPLLLLLLSLPLFSLLPQTSDDAESDQDLEEPVLLECVAIHPYKGQYEDELSFKAGDRVEVTADSKERGWGVASRLLMEGGGLGHGFKKWRQLGIVSSTADSEGRDWAWLQGVEATADNKLGRGFKM